MDLKAQGFEGEVSHPRPLGGGQWGNLPWAPNLLGALNLRNSLILSKALEAFSMLESTVLSFIELSFHQYSSPYLWVLKALTGQLKNLCQVDSLFNPSYKRLLVLSS